MTEQGRVGGSRFLLVLGLMWIAYRVIRVVFPPAGVEAAANPFGPVGLAALLASAAVAIGLYAAVLRPRYEAWIRTGRFETKASVLAAWIPGTFLLYLLVYFTLPASIRPWWNGLYGPLLVLWTAALIVGLLDVVQVVVRNPRFWLATISVLVSLVLLEAGTRYWAVHILEDEFQQRVYDPSFDPSIQYAPHHYRLYVRQPSTGDGEELQVVNRFGYRGEEIVVPKPYGVFRIVAIGGSTTFGTSVDDWRDAYPARLEAVLRERFGYGNVEVVNGGVPGYSSWETLLNLEFRALDLEPDLVILYQNTNDVHARIVPPERYEGDNSGRRRLWDPEVLARAERWPSRVPSVLWRIAGTKLGWFEVRATLGIDDLVRTRCSGHRADEDCLGMSPAQALDANPPIYYERNVRNIAAVARTHGAAVLLLTWAYNPGLNDYASREDYQRAFAEHNRILHRVAEDMDTHFFDLAAVMPRDEAYWADGRHMTAEGNQRRAEYIAGYLDDVGAVPRP